MYLRQHHSGWGQIARPIPLRNENDPGAYVERKSIIQFLDGCRQRGASELTVARYGKHLEALYDYLPKDKSIRYGTLAKWSESLIENGYAGGTVNAYLSVANMYLDFIGRREYQMSERLDQTPEAQPELSRTEYLQLLHAARRLNKERDYLLIKLFGTVDLSVRELSKLTVEAAKAGKLVINTSRSKRIVRLPEILKKELLEFADRKGYESGPIFQTRDGRPMNRAYITRMIRAICPAAGVAEDKGSTRCLQKLYRATRAGLESNISLLVDQAHERLLEQEQLRIGWTEVK